MPKTKAFDDHFAEYEQWFIDNSFAFQSELKAIQKVIPDEGNGVEIGVGSGIFASALGISNGVEPSQIMRKKAKERDINAINGTAEKLPYPDQSYEFALMVTTICFVDNVLKAFEETNRILKKNGIFIIGFVDKNSPIGKLYFKNKENSIFYKDATFYDTEHIYRCLWETGFTIETTLQTVFGMLNMISEVQEPKSGYGEGSFVVIKVRKE